MKTEYSLGQKSAYFNSVWDNWRIWMICSQFLSKNNLQSIWILTMLTVAISHLMQKIASEGRKPAMEKSIFVFPPLPSFHSLCLRHFILTFFGKSQNSFAKKVGPTVLYYLFIKLLFGKPGSEFAIEKVGPICQLSLLITLLRKTDFGLWNPLRRSSFFVFRPSTFWSFH